MSLQLSRRKFLQLMTAVGGCLGMINSSKAITSSRKGKQNIKSLGAIGDGTTDDTAAIDAALVKVMQNGGELFFPPGIYLINKPLSYVLGNHDIKLTGNNATLKFTNMHTAYNLSIMGKKKLLPDQLNSNISPTSTEIILKNLNKSNAVVMLCENSSEYSTINLSLQKLDQFNVQITSSDSFFNPSMIGKNLINPQDGVTYLILQVIDANHALVVAGNNQSKEVDLTQYTKWAIIDLWCSSRSYYKKGEFLFLNQKSTKSYSFITPSIDRYNKTNAQLFLIESGKLTINGINLVGAGQNYGVNIANILNLNLANLTINKFNNNSLTVKESVNIIFSNITIESSISGLASNYACGFNSVQNISIIKCIFKGGFHSLSHGGTFPCRNIKISQSKFGPSKNCSLDFHCDSQFADIDGVSVFGSAYFGGIDFSVTNSKFTNDSSILAAVIFGPERSVNSYTMTNCQIINQSGNGVVVASQFVADKMDRVLLNGNTISAPKGTGILLQDYAYGNGCQINNLTITNNKITNSVTKYKNVNNHNQFNIIKQDNQFI